MCMDMSWAGHGWLRTRQLVYSCISLGHSFSFPPPKSSHLLASLISSSPLLRHRRLLLRLLLLPRLTHGDQEADGWHDQVLRELHPLDSHQLPRALGGGLPGQALRRVRGRQLHVGGDAPPVRQARLRPRRAGRFPRRCGESTPLPITG